MVDLSVIIVSFNTSSITKECIEKLTYVLSNNKGITAEIIIVDNLSTDGSIEMLKNYDSRPTSLAARRVIYKLILNNKNVGFGAANNRGLKLAKGRYTLFLNSDVMIESIDFSELIKYLQKNLSVAALTIRLKLTNGFLDPACHRGFPSPWNAFCYYFKLEKFFGKVPFFNLLFGGYHLTYRNYDTIHEIDSPSGAFYFGITEIFRKLNGFDEVFFMYGEDLDLSYRLKNLGYHIIYYPKFDALHLKYQSGLKKDDGVTKSITKIHFYNAMKIFYKKHYASGYPKLFNNIIYTFLNLIK